ncbi:hypothetical protein SELMODRAFT_447533 [Selaginella moellendorffii]|uniref:F-box domain-containing protein n=1 Tax=Selaginella moellendorffii TaxID=88036 RepID=D8T092_SELML|nr:hypothetical protein SELMODRAFT_447533 [Selaginella moellendorffii]
MTRTRERAIARSVAGSSLLFTRNQRQMRMVVKSAMAQRQRKRAKRRKSSVDLLPGLIHDVVYQQILPRLPWYQRPVMTAVSKLWRAAMESLNAELGARSRELQDLPRGVVLLFNAGSGSDGIFQQQSFFELFDYSTGTWHELPPLPDRSPEESVEECFCFERCIYGICKGEIYKLDLPAGIWRWEKLTTRTRINGGVAVAFMEDGMLYLSGKRAEVFVLEKHDLANRCAKSICVQLVGFSGLAAQKGDVKSLFEGFSDWNRVAGTLAFLFQIKPLNISRSCTAPAFVSERKFLVATRKCYLELHDLDTGLLDEINVQRKLRLVVSHTIVALAYHGGVIYVLMQVDKGSHASFSLWRGEACGDSLSPELGKFEWKRAPCPLKFGDHCNKASLQILS